MCWNFGRIPPISWLDDQGSQGVWNWTEVLPFPKLPLGCAPWYWMTINLGSTATNITSGLNEIHASWSSENIELYNSKVKSWRVGIARCCSRLWPPEARPDNFFTRPTCNGSKRPSAMLSIKHDQVQFRVSNARGAFFAWRAPILSWPRIICSQVRMLEFLEPSQEMP